MSTIITATRYHDFSCGHRVAGHESKCSSLHGHNYRVHFECRGDLDIIGRVLDFSVIKSLLCEWLESNWDHKFLAWDQDPVMKFIDSSLYTQRHNNPDSNRAATSIVFVPFNPTAENMALHLLNVVGPEVLADTGVRLVSVRVEETRKCSATATIEGPYA